MKSPPTGSKLLVNIETLHQKPLDADETLHRGYLALPERRASTSNARVHESLIQVLRDELRHVLDRVPATPASTNTHSAATTAKSTPSTDGQNGAIWNELWDAVYRSKAHP